MAIENDAAAGKPAPKSSGAWVGYLLKYGLPLLISLGLCWLLFTGVDFGEMVRIIKQDCNYWWIAAALFLSIFSHVFRALRWRIQLRAIDVRPPLFVVILSIFGTYAVNLILPRLGELWRTGYIAQREKAPFDAVFGSMMADRLADTVTVLLLTVATFLFAGNSLLTYLQQDPDSYRRLLAVAASPWLWGGVALTVAVVWWLFVRYRKSAAVVRLKEFCRGLWKGFSAIATMPGKGRWLLLTVCLWGSYFFQLYLAFFSFPATAEVVSRYGVEAVMVCFIFSSISMGVPSNGGIGPWQWAIIFGLSLYSAGIPELTKNYATSFANLVMGSQTLLLILLGLFTFACIAISKRRKTAV